MDNVVKTKEQRSQEAADAYYKSVWRCPDCWQSTCECGITYEQHLTRKQATPDGYWNYLCE